jgi:hypothetical protein
MSQSLKHMGRNHGPIDRPLPGLDGERELLPSLTRASASATIPWNSTRPQPALPAPTLLGCRHSSYTYPGTQGGHGFGHWFLSHVSSLYGPSGIRTIIPNSNPLDSRHSRGMLPLTASKFGFTAVGGRSESGSPLDRNCCQSAGAFRSCSSHPCPGWFRFACHSAGALFCWDIGGQLIWGKQALPQDMEKREHT